MGVQRPRLNVPTGSSFILPPPRSAGMMSAPVPVAPSSAHVASFQQNMTPMQHQHQQNVSQMQQQQHQQNMSPMHRQQNMSPMQQQHQQNMTSMHQQNMNPMQQQNIASMQQQNMTPMQPQYQQQQQPIQAPSMPDCSLSSDESHNGTDPVKMESRSGPSLAERVNTLRLNGVGFDVTFVLGPAPASTTVEAHRVVMAAGSSFFENLLYGDESETPAVKKKKGNFSQNSDSCVFEFPDVDAVAFQTIIEYLYSDFDKRSINIDEAALLHTLYAARKFNMDDLEVACVSLLGDLTPTRAVTLIEQAVNFNSDELFHRCMQVIDEETDDALSSDAILNVQKDTLKNIVSRNELSPSDEISVFRAICAWADAECKRCGVEPTPESKRRILDNLFDEIRFPTMTIEEFGEAANSGMLSDVEIGLMFRYLTAAVHADIKLPFITHERRLCGRSKFVVRRFMNLSKNNCKKQRSTIWFIVNREILVTALGIYGLTNSETNAEGTEWETTIDIEIASSSPAPTKETTTVTLKGTYGDGRVYVARFKKPARVTPNVPHRATVMFHEDVETYSGGNGVEDVRVHVGGSGGLNAASGTNCAGQEGINASSSSAAGSSAVSVLFAFHNDDPNGVRRGMTRGPAVFTSAIGGFYNRPAKGSSQFASEGCLYEGQIPEIYFLAPNEMKKESDA